MREYLQHVVSVTVISSAHIKGNSIFGKMLILWEIQGKYKKNRMLDTTWNWSIKIQTKVKSYALNVVRKIVWKEIFYPDWSEFNKRGVIYNLFKLIIDGIGEILSWLWSFVDKERIYDVLQTGS